MKHTSNQSRVRGLMIVGWTVPIHRDFVQFVTGASLVEEVGESLSALSRATIEFLECKDAIGMCEFHLESDLSH